MIYNLKNEQKIRLDEFLRIELPKKLQKECSNSKIRRLIISGSVFVNENQVRRPAFVLFKNSNVSVNFEDEKFFFEKTQDDIKFDLTEKDVLFEDEYLICVNKPAFFPTEETIVGNEKRDNLHQAVIRYLWQKNPQAKNPPYVGIMHRLDRETSGIILFTKSRVVNKQIQSMFENHDFTKIYTALSTQKNLQKKSKYIEESEQNPREFTVNLFMNRISPKSQKAKWGIVLKEKGGLLSKTKFTILKEEIKNQQKYFFIQAELFTGRTHQIRVHLSEAGLPILGDELYGGLPSKRIMLHSTVLIFNHPVTKENIKITCEPNFDF